jgi:phosphatidylglycerophosphatase A
MTDKITPSALIKDPGHALSFGFGSGLSPYAPGTMGTLAAIPFYLLAAQFGTLSVLIACLCICVLGIYLCARTTSALGVHDHPAIVWDEIAGYFVTMLFAPVSIATVIIGFVLFRMFDILKPWPISVIDSRLKGGLGVMLDDILAGIFALIVLQLILHLGWVS